MKQIVITKYGGPDGLEKKSVFGVNLGHMWNERDKIGGWMQEILKGVAQGWVRPHVDRTFPLEQAGDAHAYIEARKNIGKVVIVTGKKC